MRIAERLGELNLLEVLQFLDVRVRIETKEVCDASSEDHT